MPEDNDIIRSGSNLEILDSIYDKIIPLCIPSAASSIPGKSIISKS